MMQIAQAGLDKGHDNDKALIAETVHETHWKLQVWEIDYKQRKTPRHCARQWIRNWYRNYG